MVVREGESCYNAINLTMIAKPQVVKEDSKRLFWQTVSNWFISYKGVNYQKYSISIQ